MLRTIFGCLVVRLQFENPDYHDLDSIMQTNFDTGTVQEYNTVTVVSGSSVVSKSVGTKRNWISLGLRYQQQFIGKSEDICDFNRGIFRKSILPLSINVTVFQL